MHHRFDARNGSFQARAVVHGAASLGLPAPSADLALGGLAFAMGLRPGSPTAIFTVARLVGVLAHAMEEYPHRLRFRPRASYVGPPASP